jgi:hypothetical protein
MGICIMVAIRLSTLYRGDGAKRAPRHLEGTVRPWSAIDPDAATAPVRSTPQSWLRRADEVIQ